MYTGRSTELIYNVTLYHLRVRREVPRPYPVLSQLDHLYILHPGDQVVVPVRDEAAGLPRPGNRRRRPAGYRLAVQGVLGWQGFLL